MNGKRVVVGIAVLLLGACDENPVQPSLMADLVSDGTPPTLAGFSFSPTSINTSGAAASVTVSFTATDDVSGATYVFVLFQSPSGHNSVGNSSNFSAATNQTGSFEVTFPQYAESGEWAVQYVYLQDAVGNYRYMYASDLSAMGFPTGLAVFSAVQDATPPMLGAFSFSPTSINTSGATASVTVSFTATDDVSGATYVFVLFQSPSGHNSVGNSSNFSAATNQTGSFEVTFPQYAESGEWVVQYVYLQDGVGNYQYMYASDLSAMGFPTALTVLNSVQVAVDIQPGSALNSINLRKQGKVPVAILSNPGFDAPSEVNRTSLTFGRTGSEVSLASCARGGEDVNGDAFKDMVCQFYAQKTGFRTGDVEGILRGQTLDGVPIEGRDAVRILR